MSLRGCCGSTSRRGVTISSSVFGEPGSPARLQLKTRPKLCPHSVRSPLSVVVHNSQLALRRCCLPSRVIPRPQVVDEHRFGVLEILHGRFREWGNPNPDSLNVPEGLCHAPLEVRKRESRDRKSVV